MSDNITLPRAAEQVRKALELALESQFAPDDAECEHGMHYRDCSNNSCVMRDCKAAIDALDAALAEPTAKPEPVAWMYVNLEGECEQIEYGTPSIDDDSITLLYAAPPEPTAKREPESKTPAWWMDGLTVTLMREGVNKHRAREIAIGYWEAYCQIPGNEEDET